MIRICRLEVLLVSCLLIEAPLTLRAQPSAGLKAPEIAEQSLPVEWSYRSSKAYTDPFNDVDLNVIFVNTLTGKQWRVPTFWAGENEWRIRFAPPETGLYKFHAESTDKTNPDLNGHEGTLRVAPYSGTNALLVHGPLHVSPDRHYFQFADGTPFLWLGDTWWDGLCNRISLDGFRTLAADRHGKGFDVVQIVAGLNPDEEPFDGRGNNEGGYAWEPNYTRINPQYFNTADQRIRALVQAELSPAIVGSWGYFLEMAGVEKMKKHWRNLIARYGAYPVVWIMAGEVDMPYYLSPHPHEDAEFQKVHWTEMAHYIRETDPYHHLITTHPSRSGREELLDDHALDFDMLQTGHGSWGSAASSVASISAHRSKTPPMPSLIGETVYEGHQQTNWQDSQRFSFWVSMMNGAAGYTYGAGGIWEMNGITVPHGPSPWGITYEDTPWNEAMLLPGSRQVGIGKSILLQYPWNRLEPHPDWVEPHGTTFQALHDDWFDVDKRWDEEKGEYLLPYASGIPGQLRLIYIPPRIYKPTGPLVVNIEGGVTYRAAYIDPVTGRSRNLGNLVRPQLTQAVEDTFTSSLGSNWVSCTGHPSAHDGALLTEGELWSTRKDVHEADLLVHTKARSDADSGILLRFHDADNALIAIYSPTAKAIWIHDRRNGEFGRQLGYMEVPEIGPEIELDAEAHGPYASLTITDGHHVYRTSPAAVSNILAGAAGLWSERLACQDSVIGGGCTPVSGEANGPNQSFSDFKVFTLSGVSADANPNLVILNSWRAPNLPLSHDWVLALQQ